MGKMQSRMNQSHRPRRAQLRIVLLQLPSESNAPSQKSPEADRRRSASLHPVCQCARLARRRAHRLLLLLLLRADSPWVPLPVPAFSALPRNFPHLSSWLCLVSHSARRYLALSANTLPLLARGSSVLS